MKLLDLNVWLATVWAGHIHHTLCKAWMDSQAGPLHFCRITQMGLLRLLSNPSILGEDYLDRKSAWQVYETLQQDPRIDYLAEPANLEFGWLLLSKREDHAHKLWTDDYLAAFSSAAGLTLVTLDKKLPGRYPSIDVELLENRRIRT